MKSTHNISLGGYAFVIEEDAFIALQGYIEKVRAHASEDVREELVSDIEERLAELFIEQRGKGTVIDLKIVDSAASRIGIPEDAESGSDRTGRGAETYESRSGREKAGYMRKKLFRDTENRILGGVLAGISNWLETDAVILRLAYSIFVLCPLIFRWRFYPSAFWTIMLYLLLWIIVPAPKTVDDRRRAKGRPINFEDFMFKAESFGTSVGEAAKEVSTAPFFRMIGRFIAVSFGIVFLVVGMALSISAIIAALSIPSAFTDIPWIVRDAATYRMLTTILDNPVIVWTAVGSVAFLGLAFLYAGVTTTFALKSPKWNPGLLIFLFWLGLTITCIAFAAKELAFMYPWIVI